MPTGCPTNLCSLSQVTRHSMIGFLKPMGDAMLFRPWMLKSWPKLDWYPPPDSENWASFGHLNTLLHDDSDPGDCRRGDTVWAARVGKNDVAIGWEWVEFKRGVPVLLDPNSITSNIRFLTEDNKYVEPLPACASLNWIVHGLPWQDAVLLVIAASANSQSAKTSANLNFREPNLRSRSPLQFPSGAV
jgi:hypothetical protein